MNLVISRKSYVVSCAEKLRIFLFFLTLVFTYNLQLTAYSLFAQETSQLVTLSKQAMEAKTNQDAYLVLEQLKELYFKEHTYNEFVDFLNSLMKQKETLEPIANYYLGLTRYVQLKYLEEAQNWDEYFSLGNTYREQITQSLQKTVDTLGASEAVSIYARLILWKFHRDQQDIFSESAFTDLLDSTFGYAQTATNPSPLKSVADELLAYKETAKSKELYKIYVDKIATSGIKDEELYNIASGFYKEARPELAQVLYDAYLERISKTAPKEKSIPILIDTAKLFVYRDEKTSDAFYAEKIFQKIEEIGGKEALSEELAYLRAFNLEKAKEYVSAKDKYISFAGRFSASRYTDEAVFKIGMIYTYIFSDIKNGRIYFEGLAKKETVNAHSISSLYQLGLLSQWEGDPVKAKEYYDKLLAQAGEGFLETTALTQNRLKEIQEAKPLEYNLKMFLDVSLAEGSLIFDMTKVDLKASGYRLERSQKETITAHTYMPASGCMQVEVQYLWSGHLGVTNPALEQSSFETTYTQPGTKEINLVVVSSQGVLDRALDLVDVY